ncbi:MAG TPA: hypothetical protein VEV17_03335 [Bryobacteraceae bacterium]|nr:hypothetical protein [Bryobacteraceae bacterium]
MCFRFSGALLALSLAAAGQTTGAVDASPPDAVQQRKILADAAEYAVNQEQNLPNFICTQTTQRFVDFTGKSGFRPLDLIVERLTYFDHHEDYKVFMVNGEAANVSHTELGGAISSGEFGSVLKNIFAPESDTEFTWERYYTLRGRRMNVYSYRVTAVKSDYHIRVPLKKLDLVSGYHGLIFIDDRRHFVHRITQHADTIPPDYPVQDVSLALDYEYTRIGDADYLLPLEFELRSREGTHLIKNDVSYDGYRKFAADTSISFDAPAPPDKRDK